ncbi:hypothetical protein DPMN_050367 [Dreissena polymorpha]|uniref:Uncharacterized protein n=1 Tax=Dreissena polymorpha TaxID=45954 RepID=A0A9D4CGL4_DREPO|nr:hypothetical protein DPMN_050367 [Dreissena polymorpha]
MFFCVVSLLRHGGGPQLSIFRFAWFYFALVLLIYRKLQIFGVFTRFSKLQTQYPGAIAAEFDNQTVAELLEKGYNQCCSHGVRQRFCNLYQEINPPDDCSRYTISDELPPGADIMPDDRGVEKQHKEVADEGILGHLVRRVRKMVGL